MKKLHLNWLRGGGALRRVGLVLVLCLTAVGQMWGYTATWRIVPALAFGNNWSESNNIRLTIRVKTSGDNQHWTITGFSWNGLMYESGGNLYKIYEASNSSLPNDGAQEVKFMRYSGDTWKQDGSQYNDWRNCSGWNGSLYTSSWTSYTYKTWDISSGTTIVWDAGQMNWGGDGNTPQIYIYKSGYNDPHNLTKIDGSQQYYKTFNSKWSGYGGLIFRGHSDFSHGQTTNINTSVSGSSTDIVMFTHCNNSYTDGKADWQKISPAYKGTSGQTIYFDNTVTGWEHVYFKYGTPYFNRYESLTSNVVPGTNGKLLYITLPRDIYYGQFMFADGYGYTNYNPIDDSHCSHYTALQADHISSVKTYIPTANAQKGATTVLDGYERTVTIASYSHGTVHVTYTDATNTAQDKTSAGNYSVQQACVITVTATADDGYELTSLTVGSDPISSGGTYAVRANKTVTATFSPLNYTLTLNHQGATNTPAPNSISVTYDSNNNLTGTVVSTLPTKTGYPTFGGYYTQEAGGGDQLITAAGAVNGNVTGYTSSGTWVKADNAEVYAKWTQIVTLYGDGSTGDGSATVVYNATSANTPTPPTYTDHTVDLGYYAESGCTNKVMGTDGSLTNYSGYVESGKWVHSGATTLYPHWKVNQPSISCTDNVVAITVPTGSAVYYTTDGSTTPTSSSTLYEGTFTIAANTTVKAIAIQDGCTSSDVKTYDATYTPVYTVGFSLTNASKSTGETSVLENKSYTATFSDVTGYDLPTTVGVTIGGTPKTVTTDYTWNQGTGTLTILENKINGNVVITVNGVAETYTISYKDQGDEDYSGSNLASLPTSHTYGSATALVNGVKSGYRFEGWYTDEECTVSAGSSIGATAITANTTYYAKWAQLYTITNGNPTNGTITVVSSAAEGDVVSISASGSTGYNFSSWNIYKTGDESTTVSPAASSATTTFTMPAYAVTVNATFEAKTYTAANNIDKNGGTTAGQYTATYNADRITINSVPEYPGYEIDYYARYAEGGDKIANADGTLVSGLTGIISSYKWIYDGTDLTLYAIWTPKLYTVTLDRNGGTTGSTSFTVHAGNSDYSAITFPTRTGYDFTGYYTSGGTMIFDEDGVLKGNVTGYTDSYSHWTCTDEDLELQAHWTPVDLTFSTAGNWNTASNWDPACVPTSEHDVTISAAATVSGDAVAKSVTIASGGSLTIAATGVLEVAGTVTNTDASKLVIKSNSTAQGALIFDNSASAKATVDIYTKLNTYDSYQVIAIPVTTTGVSESFAGSGVYTYVWNEGDGWERRGYYNDLDAFEAIALMQTASHTYTVSGTLASTDDFSETLAYTTGTYQGTNVFGNSWTAPIKIKEIEIPAEKAEQTVYVLENGNWVAYTLGSVANEVVPAMQAYAIIATATGGTVSIDYDDAVRGAASHNNALRAPQRSTSEDQVQMALDISDGERQTALRLHEDALLFTEDFDNGWEARFLEGDGLSGQLYVQKENQMVVLAEPDLEGTVVGLIPGVASSYTISFEGDGAGYYLNDMVTEQSTLIAEGNTYMFTSDENTNATRFVISRMPINHMPTDIDNVQGDNVQSTKARKQMIDGILYIIRDGRIYSAQGALVK